jgi:hypothetical protein
MPCRCRWQHWTTIMYYLGGLVDMAGINSVVPCLQGCQRIDQSTTATCPTNVQTNNCCPHAPYRVVKNLASASDWRGNLNIGRSCCSPSLHAPPLLCQLTLWQLLQGGQAAAGSRTPAPLPLLCCQSAPIPTLSKQMQRLKRIQNRSALHSLTVRTAQLTTQAAARQKALGLL